MSYRVHHNTSSTITLKKSEFMTYLFRLESADEIKEIIKEVRKVHYKATHVCTAYRIDQKEQANDDGEPSGTAGQPMLETLRTLDIDHILVCVVRYYGGIQLGASGLIRAYRSSVVEAIKHASLTQMSEMVETVCSLEYAQLDQKLLAIEKISAIQHKDFDEMVILTLHSSEDIQTKLTEITNGQIKIISISIKEVENEIHKELNYE